VARVPRLGKQDTQAFCYDVTRNPHASMPQIPLTFLSDATLAAGYAIFAASYLVFAIGKFPGLKIDRPAAAIIGAVAMVAFRIVPARGALAMIDFPTIVLLFSMMVIVGSLHLCGFFEWTADLVWRRLRPNWFMPAVIFTTGILSAFLVNDIVCLVMVPLVLNLTRRLRLPALPLLLAVATASNIGSVATITGNPQNMLIGSYSGIQYRDFLFHLGPVAVAGLFFDWLVLWWLFRRELKGGTSGEISITPVQPSKLWKPGLVLACVVIGFFAGAPPALASALGAAALLISRTTDSHKLYGEVDWGLLVFFVGLFLIVGGAENAGILAQFFKAGDYVDLHASASFTLVTVVLSNLVSNVPAVMLLKSLVPGFADPHRAWLLLAMASTLAGNLTITGSVANIIVVETAKPDLHIGFRQYFRAGLPVTIGTLLIGWAWLRLA
jgi:Na+/H+ antiporter NhaD/arsenite permease-like protein